MEYSKFAGQMRVKTQHEERKQTVKIQKSQSPRTYEYVRVCFISCEAKHFVHLCFGRHSGNEQRGETEGRDRGGRQGGETERRNRGARQRGETEG